MPIENFQLIKDHHWSGIGVEERNRQEAILEFITTESTYYNRLLVLHEVYFGGSVKYLSGNERSAIFQNLDELLLRSSLFLSDLQNRQSVEKGLVLSIADIFLNHISHFDCLQQYCVGHEEAVRVLNKIESGNSKFKTFLQKCADDSRCFSLDLSSFLLEPVQRIARYPLLLKQILHYTAKESEEYEKVLEAIRAGERFLQKVNEAVRSHESTLRLSHLQSNLLLELSEDDIPMELIGLTQNGTNRLVILETPLRKVKSGRRLIGLLLTDMILLLEPVSAGYRLYCAPLDLKHVSLQTVCFESTKVKLASGLKKECCFEIKRAISGECDSILVATETIGEKTKWIDCFQEAHRNIVSPSSLLLHSPLSLPCIGTLRITLIRVASLPCTSKEEFFCTVTLNQQQIHSRRVTGPAPLILQQSEVLLLSSYDEYLELSVWRYAKFSPSEVVGRGEVSLGFLEYYGERETQEMDMDIGGGAKIFFRLQYRC